MDPPVLLCTSPLQGPLRGEGARESRCICDSPAFQGEGTHPSDRRTMDQFQRDLQRLLGVGSIDAQRHLQVVELGDQLAHAVAAGLLLDAAQVRVDRVFADGAGACIVLEP